VDPTIQPVNMPQISEEQPSNPNIFNHISRLCIKDIDDWFYIVDLYPLWIYHCRIYHLFIKTLKLLIYHIEGVTARLC